MLGTVPRLLYAYRGDVKWDPADHLCVAGELLTHSHEEERWLLSGAVYAVERAHV